MAAQTTSTKALLYFSERVEDATEAVKGLLSGRTNGAGSINGLNGGQGGSSSSRYLDTSDDAVRVQLESDRDDVRIEGLRTVIALISKGRDASGYFASVVKLSSNRNLEVRKLVYCIVRRYARKQPDIALLGINSFQRDLLDRNDVIRMMALRVLTGLRLSVAASVIEYAISRSVRDTSFHVRRAAALSLIKCRSILTSAGSHVIKNHLDVLLQDRHPSVLGAALVAWKALLPNDVTALHQHYRKLCFALNDMDEWAQHEAVNVLVVYCKRCFEKPVDGTKPDSDLTLFLNKAIDLLSSRNTAVVIAAINALRILGDDTYQRRIFTAALRVMNVSSEVALCVLLTCIKIISKEADSFRSEVYCFLPRSSAFEPGYITMLKLRIMATLASKDTFDEVMTELVEQAENHSSNEVAALAVRLLGDLSKQSTGEQRQQCIKELLRIVRSNSACDAVTSEALVVLSSVVETSSKEDAAGIILRLSTFLFTASSTTSKESSRRVKIVGKSAVKAPTARAHIYWMLGQYCQLPLTFQTSDGGAGDHADRTLAELVALDTLRLAAINFPRESVFAKLQIVTLSTKLVVVLPRLQNCEAFVPAVRKIHAYVLQLARYDEDFDLRDRARFLKSLSDRTERENVKSADEVTLAFSEAAGDDGQYLGGVVLRRAQVEHVLFEGRTTPLTSERQDQNLEKMENDIFDTIFGPRAAASLSKDYFDAESEPWADKEKLPPAHVREPVEEPLATSSAESQAANLLRANTEKSLSSADYKHSSGSVSPQPAMSSYQADLLRQNDMRTASPASMTAPSQPSAAKYKDLDDFLNAPSSSESSMDGTMDEREPFDNDTEEEYEDQDEEEEGEDQSGAEEDESDDEEEEDASDVKEETRTKVQVPAEEANAWASDT